jgi:hypothetical protein
MSMGVDVTVLASVENRDPENKFVVFMSLPFGNVRPRVAVTEYFIA